MKPKHPKHERCGQSVDTWFAAAATSRAIMTMAPSTWRPVGLAPAEFAATFHISLNRRKPEALAAAVALVSDPRNISGRFRHYLSDDDIAALVQPISIIPVEEWLHSSGADVVRLASSSGQVLEVRANMSVVVALFGSTLSRYRSEDGFEVFRSSTLSPPNVPVPLRLRGLVEAVHGLFDLPHRPSTRPRMRLSREPLHQQGLGCQFKGDIVDPTVLQQQYRYPNTSLPYGRVSQGVAAFEDAQFDPNDVTAFEAYYQLPNVSLHVKGPNKGGFYGEAGLDTQYIVATGAGLPSWFLAREAFDMLAWCEMVLAMPEPPSVLSISWGGPESNYPEADQRAADQCFQRAALKGISVLAASGDEGTGRQSGPLGFGCKRFDPTWPASSPHVTAVGATYLTADWQGDHGEDSRRSEKTRGESGWSFSGGGYSAIFPRPPWQDAAVATYQNLTTLPPAKLFNESGRVTPDVSAVGTCFAVFGSHLPSGTPTGTLSGTSASTPAFAGLISRINNARVAAGKPTLGLLNPTLYQAGRVGTDITVGANKCRGCPAGFEAAPGFDAVTGLGTPLWPVLQKLLLA